MENNYIFLLGGKDLEMLEIEKILKKNNYKYIDNHLSWGAKLSDYKMQLKELKKDDVVVGIELYKDSNIENKYIEIDHHNKNIEKPSSIEQIAELLNVKLNRYQRLVAENDKGHIKALKDFGATNEEIYAIRAADRRCQGVTEEDERLAEKSIKENKKTENEIVIVKSLTDKFSPICDRLYDIPRLIIYTNDELNYYGIGAKKFGMKYQKIYGDSKVYFGGGENGFFGFAKGVLNQDEIEQKKNEIISIKSYHIFMFPFKWEYIAKDNLEKLSFKARTNISKVIDILKEENWIEYSLKEKMKDNYRIYNQLMFFYEHAQDAIYDKENDDKNWVHQFKYIKKDKCDCKYIIEIDEDEKKYELQIDDIILKLYKTGIGILSFHLANYYEINSEDILKINDYGRRIYPQFLGKTDKNSSYLSAPQNQFLASKLILELKNLQGESRKIEEDVTYFTELEKVNASPNKIPRIIKELLGDKFKDGKKDKVRKKEVYIKPIIDDRMFVVSWFGDNNKITYLGDNPSNIEYEDYLNYFNSDTKQYSYLDKITKVRKQEIILTFGINTYL